MDQPASPGLQMARRNRRSVGLVLGLLLAQLLAGGLAAWLVQTQGQNLPPAHSLWPLAIFVVLGVLMTLGLASATLVAMFGGFWLGAWGLAYTVPGYLLATWVGYQLARRTDGGALAASLPATGRFRRWWDRLQGRPLALTFICRLLPLGLSFALTNTVLALSGLRPRPYLLGGLLGMLPRTLLATWAGAQAHQLTELLAGLGAYRPYVWGGGLLLAVMVAVLAWRGRKA
jgi:uncharacterized membrane protein YdjX (TVP38/TMEM64 family)